jgi:outer membrane receptor protein involved in Fe transport
MKKILITLCALFTISVGIHAQQTFTVQGRVTDSNGESLTGVNIIIKGTSLGAATDLNGQYLIKNVPEGKHIFEALYVGYDSQEKELTVQTDLTVDFQLTSGIILEGLVVTAQKREQSIKEIPTAITSLGSQFMKETGQSEISELATYIPGLEVQLQSPNNPGFVIRGITSDDGSSNIEPRVSIFQDGVSISKSRGSVVEVFDMERIEALKGPQGTLFGRGAQIGALHFIQNKPQNNLDLGAAIGLGDFNYRYAEMFVNVPVVQDKLLFRGAGIYKFRDGFIKNLSGGTLNGKDTKAVRASLKYLATPQTNFTLIKMNSGIQNDYSFQDGLKLLL